MMTTPTALICVRGYGVPALLDAAHRLLAPGTTWTILHVLDSRPASEVDRALHHLPGRAHAHAEARLQRAATDAHAAIAADVATWLGVAGREAELIMREGRPEREIVALAAEIGVALVLLGGAREIGPHRLGPVVQYVVDHAPCATLIVHPPR